MKISGTLTIAALLMGLAAPALYAGAGSDAAAFLKIDAGARAAAMGAYYNVLINLSGMKEKAWRTRILKRADLALAQVEKRAKAIETSMRVKLRKPLS